MIWQFISGLLSKFIDIVVKRWLTGQRIVVDLELTYPRNEGVRTAQGVPGILIRARNQDEKAFTLHCVGIILPDRVEWVIDRNRSWGMPNFPHLLVAGDACTSQTDAPAFPLHLHNSGLSTDKPIII